MHPIGHRMAQVGGVLMIAGGAVDMTMRNLLPYHEAVLSDASGTVPQDAAALVLALLRALGGALVAAGVAILMLLHLGRASQARSAYVVAGATAILAEGPNAAGMLSSGSPFFIAPVLFMLLVAVGCVVCVLSLPSPAASKSRSASEIEFS